MIQRVTLTLMRYHTFSPSFTGLGYNATCYHNFKMLPHALPYIFFKFSMVFGAICNALPRVTVKFIKIYVLIFKKKQKNKTMVTCGNVLQIAQNQANLRKNIQ